MNTTTTLTVHRCADTIAREIAKHLPGWKAVSYNDNEGVAPFEGRPAWRSKLVATDASGRSLFISTTWGGKGKLHVSGNYPERTAASGRREQFQPVNQPKIGVSLDATPERMAKEIARRLVPDYNSGYNQAMARMQNAIAYENKTQSMAKELSDLVGSYNPTRSRGEAEANFWHAQGDLSGDFKVYGDSATLTLRCSHDVARKVAKLIAEERAEYDRQNG
jgi:hypothetical protein